MLVDLLELEDHSLGQQYDYAHQEIPFVDTQAITLSAT